MRLRAGVDGSRDDGARSARNVIVEIATIVTDDELNIVAEGPDLVIGATPEQLADMDDVVLRMHTASGLLTAIRESKVTVEEAAAATLEFVKSQVPTAGDGAAVRELDRDGPQLPAGTTCRRSTSTSTTARSTSRA